MTDAKLLRILQAIERVELAFDLTPLEVEEYLQRYLEAVKETNRIFIAEGRKAELLKPLSQRPNLGRPFTDSEVAKVEGEA